MTKQIKVTIKTETVGSAFGIERRKVTPSRRATKVPTPAERVAYACSPDEVRANMLTPFALTFHGHEWVAATDGHRAHLVRVPEAPAVHRDGPPLDKVLTDFAHAPRIGSIAYDSPLVAALRELPRRWVCAIDLGRGHMTATAPRKDKPVHVLDAVMPPGFVPVAAGAGEGRGVNAAYLFDALDALAAGVIIVRQSDALSPYYLHADTADLGALTEFAVVMPCRL